MSIVRGDAGHGIGDASSIGSSLNGLGSGGGYVGWVKEWTGSGRGSCYHSLMLIP